MKNILYFENHTDYASKNISNYMNSISLCDVQNDVHYIKSNHTGYEDIVPVQYLRTTGTQKINLQVIPSTNTKIQMKFRNITKTGGQIIGYQITDSRDWRFFNYNNAAYFDIVNKRITGGTINQGTDYEIELGNYYVKNLLTNTNIVSGTAFSYTGESNIVLNGDTSPNMFYYVKIFDGNNLIKDFIPVRIGQVGYMYDKVSGQLFANNGTGNFTLGPDL